MTTETERQTSEPDYGPSLPELLRPRLRAVGRAQRLLLAVALGVAVALVAALVIRSETAIQTYRQGVGDAQRRGLPAIPFDFDYSSRLRLSKPPGAYARVERTVDGTLAARFTVLPLRLARPRGLLSGFLPILANRHERRAARAFEGFRLQFEGRARLNEVEGYQFAFSARLSEGAGARQLFGRFVLLPKPFDLTDLEKPYPPGQGPTSGLLIQMLATTLDDVPSATRVGDEGILQRPYRSLRYGS